MREKKTSLSADMVIIYRQEKVKKVVTNEKWTVRNRSCPKEYLTTEYTEKLHTNMRGVII
jgi:hypothetical protein